MTGTPVTLFSLPSELLAQILSHLDLPSLAAASSTNSTLHSVCHTYNTSLSRTIAIRHALADAKTASAADRVRVGKRWAVKSLRDDHDESELSEAIKSQGSMGDLQRITDWPTYARARYSIDQNWLHGRCTSRLIPLDLDGISQDGLIWRFKLDVGGKMIVASGLQSGCYAFNMNGECVWSSVVPMDPFSHVELSEGYLALSLSNLILILRRSDLPPSSEASVIPPQLRQTLTSIMRTHLPSSSSSPGLGYELDGFVAPSIPARATKFRYPYLFGATSNASHIFRYNVQTRENCVNALPRFAAPAEDDSGLDEKQVTYVELDGRNLVLAGDTSVTLWKDLPFVPTVQGRPAPSTDAKVKTWPPPPPPDVVLLAPLLSGGEQQQQHHYRDPENGQAWSAVHHDSQEGHLVAVAGRREGDERARLMWTCEYQEAIWGKAGEEDAEGADEEVEAERLNQKTVVLVTQHASLTELSVENGRAVFIAETDDAGCSVWVVNLRPFKDHADFAADPPKPICLAYPLPTLSSPSRVEQTSTEIFLPVSSPFYRPFLLGSSSDALDAALDAALDPDGEEFEALLEELADRQEEEGADLATLFGACETLGPSEGRMPLSFKWQTLDGQTLVDYVELGMAVDWSSKTSLSSPEDEDEEGEEEGLWRNDTGEEEWKLMERRWRAVRRRAEEEGLPSRGGSDAMMVWSFARGEEVEEDDDDDEGEGEQSEEKEEDEAEFYDVREA